MRSAIIRLQTESPHTLHISHARHILNQRPTDVLTLSHATAKVRRRRALEEICPLPFEILCVSLGERAGWDVEDAGVGFALVDRVYGVDC